MKTNQDNEKRNSSFAQYIGVAFQMLATIGLFIFIGHWIDQYSRQEKPIFTAVFAILGVSLSLYQVISTLNKK